MEVVHTCPDIRCWSEVLCCIIRTNMSELEAKVTVLEKNCVKGFWWKILEAKRDSGELHCPVTVLILICHHTIVARYNGFTLVFCVSSVCLPSIIWLSIFSLADYDFSNYSWIFTKLGMCIDILEIWFGSANGKISSIFRIVTCTCICVAYQTIVVGNYHFMFVSFSFKIAEKLVLQWPWGQGSRFRIFFTLHVKLPADIFHIFPRK